MSSVQLFVLQWQTKRKKIEPVKNLKTTDVYVIQSTAAIHPIKLVLEASGRLRVLTKRFTGSKSQLWKFQNASRPDLFYIINEEYGKVLDLIANSDDGRLQVGVSDLQKCLRQQWHVALNGRIVNAAGGKVFHLEELNTRGEYVTTSEENNVDFSQKLLIENPEDIKMDAIDTEEIEVVKLDPIDTDIV